MKKVSKTAARKAYANTQTVYLLPCKEDSITQHRKAVKAVGIQIIDSGQFDAAVQIFIDNECSTIRGRYPHYYINQ